MKKLLAATVILAILEMSATQSFAVASHRVRSYNKKDGTHVSSHRKTNSDSSKLNNWSSKGNTNPDTGKKGTVDPDKK